MLEDGHAYLLTRYPLEPKYVEILKGAFRKAVEGYIIERLIYQGHLEAVWIKNGNVIIM